LNQVQIVDWPAPVMDANRVENSVLHVLQFQQTSVRRNPPKGKGLFLI
jgi:hypothetical protein